MEKKEDLQEVLDSMPFQEVFEISNIQGEPTKEQVEKSLDILREAFKIEMGMELPEDDVKLVQDLYEKLMITTALYCNVKNGHIKILKGRINLIHDTCEFKLTKKGIEFVENMINK